MNRVCRRCRRGLRKGGEHREHRCEEMMRFPTIMLACGCVCRQRAIAAITARDGWPHAPIPDLRRTA